MRVGIRLGLLVGIALALFKIVQGRRAAGDMGRPAGEWAPTPVPAPNPNLPKPPPEPELIQPVILEEVVAKKAMQAAPDGEPAAPPAGSAARQEKATIAPTVAAVKKAAPAKKAAAKKAAAKKAAAKKAAAKKAASPKKAAPAKKAAKKQQ